MVVQQFPIVSDVESIRNKRWKDSFLDNPLFTAEFVVASAQSRMLISGFFLLVSR